MVIFLIHMVPSSKFRLLDTKHFFVIFVLCTLVNTNLSSDKARGVVRVCVAQTKVKWQFRRFGSFCREFLCINFATSYPYKSISFKIYNNRW